MTIASGTLWAMIATATAGNVNGGGFNINNANMISDWAADTNTGNTSAPILSSVTYATLAGDNGHWFYLKTGTNCYTLTRYPITASGSGKITLNAAAGAASTYSAIQDEWIPTTVVGISSSVTPTGITGGIDYTMKTTAIVNGVTDFNSTTISPLNLTSATAAFTPAMVGNIFHQTTTGTGGFGLTQWFEIVTYVNATTVTLDRTPNSGTASVNCTGYIGGAMSMGALDDAFFETLVPGNFLFTKTGTYSIGAAISVGTALGTATSVIKWIGFNTVPGDEPAAANWPVMASGANAITLATNWWHRGISCNGTASTMFTDAASNRSINCKFVNTSTTANRVAHAGSTAYIMACEAVSYRGYAFSSAAAMTYHGCRAHDSVIGMRNTSASSSIITLIENTFENNSTAGLQLSGGLSGILLANGNVFYGAENKLGVGIDIATGATNQVILNNIFYGLTTGIQHADSQTQALVDYNTFFNNTNDVSSTAQVQKGPHNIAVNPSFINATQVTGATATTTAGNHLVQAGATFITSGVVAGDYVYVVSGTGVTAGTYMIQSVDSETQITTDIAITANATGDKVFQIAVGHNLATTGAL